MKTKTLLKWLLLLVTCTATTANTIAQQQTNPKQLNQVTNQKYAQQGNYTAHVFKAPNKTYGYDILINGKVIYHQPAFSKIPRPNDLMITKEEQANAAALLAIDKIKRGQNPELTDKELKAITAH